MRRSIHGLPTALLLACAGAARGQAPAPDRVALVAFQPVSGSVVDSRGAPVVQAYVRLVGVDGEIATIQTDAAGRFTFRAVAAGRARLAVQRLGFRPASLTVTVASDRAPDPARVVVEPVAVELDEVSITESGGWAGPLEGFRSRRESNQFGHFLDLEAIQRTHAQRPSDALRTVPGLLLIPSSRVGSLVRFRGCRPTVWLDGVRLPDAELDEVASMNDMAAIEIYRGMAGVPQQFVDRANPCGAIVVWTRTR